MTPHRYFAIPALLSLQLVSQSAAADVFVDSANRNDDGSLNSDELEQLLQSMERRRR